jgi:site-specific DNA-methyltransferase (adenine-specific)
MQLELLPGEIGEAVPDDLEYDEALGQWMTPSWAAEAICETALSGLGADDLVVEPSCGIGRFLHALPADVRAIGVEIDPRLADVARRETGRTVVTGDFRTVPLPVERATRIVGNPPFQLDVFDGMLDRAHSLLVEEGEAVLILPCYALQSSSRVTRWNARWGISQTMLPRTLFPGIRLPLALVTFAKTYQRRLHGFLLYHESREIEEMPDVYATALREGRSGWHAVVEAAIRRLGGEATVQEVCAEIAPRRPTQTRHWQEQVRKQLRSGFRRTARATYALAA